MNKKHNILLLVPPQELGYGYINKFFWQQGLLNLSTHLRRSSLDVNLEICDGNVRSIGECEDVVSNKWDLVGIHSIDHTKKHALALAKKAIKNGSKKVVFGGAAAIFSPESYLHAMHGYQKDAFISCCNGAGEQTLELLIRGEEPSKIPNLVYSQEQIIIRSPINVPMPSPSRFIFDDYQDILKYLDLQLTSGDYPYDPTTYVALSHFGCVRRKVSKGKVIKGCSFCTIPGDRYIAKNAELFWQEIVDFNLFCDANGRERVASIKDWGDSLVESNAKRLLQARPKNIADVKYSCYLSLSEVTGSMLDTLVALNCHSVYIGIDGADDSGLGSISKGYSAKHIRDSLDLLDKYDFGLEIGFVLGSEGTTKANLEGTLELATMIKERFENRVYVLQGNIIIPMPGSQIYQKLEQKIPEVANMDVQKRIKHWLDNFTEVSWDECLSTQILFEEISPRKHSYAVPAGG